MALLEQIAAYLADKLQLTVGEQVFAYEMPDDPAPCISVKEIQAPLNQLSQVDASLHVIRIYARERNNAAAKALADKCYRALRSDDRQDETTETGFIKLPDGSYPFVKLRGEPVWDSVDQQKRKTFVFEAAVVAQKI